MQNMTIWPEEEERKGNLKQNQENKDSEKEISNNSIQRKKRLKTSKLPKDPTQKEERKEEQMEDLPRKSLQQTISYTQSGSQQTTLKKA